MTLHLRSVASPVCCSISNRLVSPLERGPHVKLSIRVVLMLITRIGEDDGDRYAMQPKSNRVLLMSWVLTAG